jgi:hypothetical protein
LIDTQLSSGTKSGYAFTMAGSGTAPVSGYTAIGSPLTPNQTGVRYFCSFADAVVRYNAAAIATCDNTQNPLQ